MYPNTDRCPLSIVRVCSISGGVVVLALDAPVGTDMNDVEAVACCRRPSQSATSTATRLTLRGRGRLTIQSAVAIKACDYVIPRFTQMDPKPRLSRIANRVRESKTHEGDPPTPAASLH